MPGYELTVYDRQITMQAMMDMYKIHDVKCCTKEYSACYFTKHDNIIKK